MLVACPCLPYRYLANMLLFVSFNRISGQLCQRLDGLLVESWILYVPCYMPTRIIVLAARPNSYFSPHHMYNDLRLFRRDRNRSIPHKHLYNLLKVHPYDISESDGWRYQSVSNGLRAHPRRITGRNM